MNQTPEWLTKPYINIKAVFALFTEIHPGVSQVDFYRKVKNKRIERKGVEAGSPRSFSNDELASLDKIRQKIMVDLSTGNSASTYVD